MNETFQFFFFIFVTTQHVSGISKRKMNVHLRFIDGFIGIFFHRVTYATILTIRFRSRALIWFTAWFGNKSDWIGSDRITHVILSGSELNNDYSCLSIRVYETLKHRVFLSRSMFFSSLFSVSNTDTHAFLSWNWNLFMTNGNWNDKKAIGSEYLKKKLNEGSVWALASFLINELNGTVFGVINEW